MSSILGKRKPKPAIESDSVEIFLWMAQELKKKKKIIAVNMRIGNYDTWIVRPWK